MDRFSMIVAWAFGIMLLALSGFVAMETVSRKLFNHSFQGADELGGYVLAVGGALSFTVALLERGHIRIDLLHDRMPPGVKAVLNWLSVISLAAFGLFIGWYCLRVIEDTLSYGSRSPTAWATPMIYPQGVWYACLVIFMVASLFIAFRATRLLIAGRLSTLNAEFDAKGALDELSDELEDIRRR